MVLVQQYVFLEIDTAESLTPAQVENYLESRGWSRAETELPNGQIWTRPNDEPLPRHLTVLPTYKPHLVWPGYVKSLTSKHSRDYAGRTIELLLTLALFEQRPAPDVLTDICAQHAAGALQSSAGETPAPANNISNAENTEELLASVFEHTDLHPQHEATLRVGIQKAYSLGYDAAQYDAMGGMFG